MSTDTKPTLDVLNEQIAKLEEELASLTPRINTIVVELQKLKDQKRQPLGSNNFIWQGKSYPICKIVRSQLWYWNSDPYCGGCAERGGQRIELWSANGRVGAIAHERDSDSSKTFDSILREFQDQFGISLTKVVPLTDDGGENVRGW